MKEIETSEIEDSELKDHMDDFMDTINTTMNTTRIVSRWDISVVNSPAIRDSVNTVKSSNLVTSVNITLSNQIPPIYIRVSNKRITKNTILSNQLDQFNETIENALKIGLRRGNRMELLVLEIDEKIGKTALNS